MPLRSLVSSSVFAGLAAVLLLTAPTTVQAQSLIDFLWGGSTEWGGGRQTVSFDPKYTPGQIIVSFGDRRLYLITAKGQATSYPIAVPRDKSRWQGTTKISAKRENPSWRPTPEMLRENPKLPTWVPGGHPMNPLGVRALYLGASAYRIHGTDAPWTIGQAVSQGCIRMFNKDVLDLFPRVPVGMRVTVTWERFSTQAVASSSDGTPSSYGAPSSHNEVSQPFQPTAYKSSARRHVIRNLPPVTESVRDAQTAAVRMDEPETTAAIELPVEKPAKTETTKKAEKTEPAPTKTASRSSEPKPGAKPEAEKAPQAAASQGADRAIEAAKKAAAAAAKAAEAAREAAEVAKKAAEEARKATSNDTAKDPEKTAANGAAL